MRGGRREWSGGSAAARAALTTAERGVRARFYAARVAAAECSGGAVPVPPGLRRATTAGSRTITLAGKRLVELRVMRADEQVADDVIDGIAAELRRMKAALWAGHAPRRPSGGAHQAARRRAA